MANLPETDSFDAGVYQIETTDAVIGGAGGKSNASAINLANRTNYLKKRIEGLLTKSVAGSSNVNLTATEANNAILEFTGALTASINVVVPSGQTRSWIAINNTTGNYQLTVKTSGGVGTKVAQGERTALFTDGTNVFDVPISAKIAKVIKRQIITASGTYAPSAGMLYCEVELVGGGGGGGSAFGVPGNVSAGSGGGGGGYSRKLYSAAQIGASASVVIGAAGLGGAAGQNNGGMGGNSSFTPLGGGSTLLCNGGNLGYYGSTSTTVARNINGIASISGSSGGDINIPGQQSGWGLLLGTSSHAISGRGGDSFFGIGGQESQEGSPGNAGSGYGSGGGGGAATSTSTAGGNGRPGVCVITEFCSE
ncbi:MAG: hypothetical protein CTY18_05935 [Methylomonas sp.]|nr:MAG: hypothetical protein CTY18_05935 [Methylomonas sp.]